MAADLWSRWQREVVTTVREHYPDLFQFLRQEDIDWDAWRPLFDEGYDAEQAVNQALSGIGSARGRDQHSPEIAA